jgi:hypothetical protein
LRFFVAQCSMLAEMMASQPVDRLRPSPLAIRACARLEQRVFGTFGYPRQAPL